MSSSYTLICGSLAYDTIMDFDGRFKDRILPDQVHILNVCFMVPTLRREWGGCAGNIAYGLQLLNGRPLPHAMLGTDGQDYLARLQSFGIDTRHVCVSTTAVTAQAFITTDRDDNQITAFHPGAMTEAHDNPLDPRQDNIGLAIVAPDGRRAMLDHASALAQAGIPFVFDPGQGLPMFDGQELLAFVDQAHYVAVNDYEARLLSDRTGLSLEKLAERVDTLIVTRGAEGAWIFNEGELVRIPCVPAEAIIDPTGCGDAFRAGLLYGIAQGMDWPTIGRLASTMGALKIAQRGGQNYAPDRAAVAERFAATFGYRPW
jgi:adenosine kinase